MTSGPDPNWDGDLYRLYQQRGDADAWQDDFVEAAGDQARGQDPWSNAYGADYRSGEYGRSLFGGPGADLIGSGRSSDRASADRSARRGTPSGGGPPSISQPLPPVSQSMPSISASMPTLGAQQAPAPDASNDTGSLVRPYARTRGRTRTEYDLAIETLVSTSVRGRDQSSPATPEHRSIVGLCEEARSVAEIAAHLRLPLGVVRVLIGDMAGLGLVLIHESGMVVGDRPSMEFLERVLSGLRRL
ncbi:DUF742 domain-containing protein [Allosaccharopolyspora coralli]|uniref:DUF742 domain-containing protein n=2 Tax=Allosaccharopolyspora coralli TaxID=2665642 RepID=A0A5Q3QAQ7_9PSEU|nr:DUF742 domain-containing protein [Allosaccharopolyspora coralli]QGK68555.1 DUF742 domain-containing protein [Allosaccharopolyspora coralli]